MRNSTRQFLRHAAFREHPDPRVGNSDDNANGSRPHHPRGGNTFLGFVATAFFVHFAHGAAVAGVCELPELFAFESVYPDETIVGANARELAGGGLHLFAAPDGKSVVAGWLLASP